MLARSFANDFNVTLYNFFVIQNCQIQILYTEKPEEKYFLNFFMNGNKLLMSGRI